MCSVYLLVFFWPLLNDALLQILTHLLRRWVCSGHTFGELVFWGSHPTILVFQRLHVSSIRARWTYVTHQTMLSRIFAPVRLVLSRFHQLSRCRLDALAQALGIAAWNVLSRTLLQKSVWFGFQHALLFRCGTWVLKSGGIRHALFHVPGRIGIVVSSTDRPSVQSLVVWTASTAVVLLGWVAFLGCCASHLARLQ